MEKITRERKGESGNVLFLILIAVALFAALSYAVTQSTRSGGGDATSETNLVNSAQVTQYPAGIRTSMVRMIIGGETATDIEFNPPSDYTNCTGAGDTPATFDRCVFHPLGGGATYQLAPSSIIATLDGTWYFNAHFEIDNIGTSDGASSDGNDIIAFLPGISEQLCKRINEELGISTTIQNNGANWLADPGIKTYMDKNYSMPAAPTGVIGTGATSNLSGQPYGCFQNNGTDYVYYHVLIER